MDVNIYVIENSLNNKLYVGRTSQSLKIRLKNHRACARRFLRDNTAKTTPFQKEMAKLGVENFSIRLLEKCSEDLANERETEWANRIEGLKTDLEYAKAIIKDLLDNSHEYARQNAEDFIKGEKK